MWFTKNAMTPETVFILIIGIIVLTVSLALGIPAGADPPPLEEQIEQAVVDGLRWLAEDAPQQPDGSWGESWDCDRGARTGLDTGV